MDEKVVYELTAKGFLALLAKEAGAETLLLDDNGLAVQWGAYTFVLLPEQQTYALHLTSEIEFYEG